MDERQPPLPRNSSRTWAIVAVAVLVVVAIAGIMLASVRPGSPGDAPAASTATPVGASAMTAASAAAASEAEGGPNQIVFASLSDQLSESSSAKLVRIADSARKAKRSVVIASKIEARPDRLEQMELAKRRAFAVRGALEKSGVGLATMSIELAELPTGVVTPAEANRIDVSLR